MIIFFFFWATAAGKNARSTRLFGVALSLQPRESCAERLLSKFCSLCYQNLPRVTSPKARSPTILVAFYSIFTESAEFGATHFTFSAKSDLFHKPQRTEPTPGSIKFHSLSASALIKSKRTFSSSVQRTGFVR